MACNYMRAFHGMPPLEGDQPLAAYGTLKSPFTGRVFADAEVDAYNQYTREFNRLTYRAEQEFMLDQRHKFFTMCAYQGFEHTQFQQTQQ